MYSLIFGGTTSNPSTTANGYNYVHSSNLAGWNSIETNRDTVVPHALTLDRLRFKVNTAPGPGKSYAITVMKNGVATALTCTISGTATSAQDLSNSVSFAAGDTISIRTTPSGTPTVPAGIYWTVRQEAAGLFAVFGGTATNPSNSTNNYNGLMSQAGWTGGASGLSSPIPASGALKNLHVMAQAAPGGATDRNFSFYINGSAGSVTCSLGSGGTTASDTTNSDSVSAGDIVGIRSGVTGNPTATNIAWSCSFQPTVDGESFTLYSNGVSLSTSAAVYDQPLGRGNNAWVTTEADAQLMLAATTIKAIYATISGIAGASKSYTLAARVAGVTTAAAVTITGAAATSGNTTGVSVTVNDDDMFSAESTPSNTPNSRTSTLGFLFYIAPTTTTYVPRFGFVNHQEPGIF